MKNVAVILSGCGFLDGAEITEAISTLVAIGQRGAAYQCFAPNKEAAETNHLTQRPTGRNRNVLEEAARIARGEIRPLEELHARDFDALAFPGGYGAALHLCDFAQKGSGGAIDPHVLRIVKEFHEGPQTHRRDLYRAGHHSLGVWRERRQRDDRQRSGNGVRS